jgi:hypothetical protein
MENKNIDDLYIKMVDGKEYRVNGIGTVCLYIALPIILCSAFDFTFWQSIGIVLVITLLRRK